MDKISKFLKKLSKKERKQIQKILLLILENKTKDLDINKLKGSDNIYRIRAGSIRIIFSKSINTNNQAEIMILRIDRRNEKTYKDF